MEHYHQSPEDLSESERIVLTQEAIQDGETATTSEERAAAFEKWLSTRPVAIRRAAAEYPVGTRLYITARAEIMFLVGWGEGQAGSFSGLLMSKYDPAMEYEKAVDNQELICAGCLPSKNPGRH